MNPSSKTKSFNEFLDEIDVLPPGTWENDVGPLEWSAVATPDEQIVAYCNTEELACSVKHMLAEQEFEQQKKDLLLAHAVKACFGRW